jgi:hypothetical protein
MLNTTEHIERANDGDIDSMLYLGDHYRKNKEYDKMIKFYLFAIEVADSLHAKINLGKYFEFVKNDFDQALIFYKKIDYKNHHVTRIDEKCSSLLDIAMKNKIFLNKKCGLCCKKNVDIFRLNSCCNKKICIKCVCGIINTKYDFICPFYRNIFEIDNKNKIILLDTDSDVSDGDENFINGIYYEDDNE